MNASGVLGGECWKCCQKLKKGLHTEDKTDMMHTSDGEGGREVGRESLSAAEVEQFVNECNESNWY